MNNRGDHRMVLMREERRVLVHRERRAFLRRLDEHFRVVELDIRPDNIGGDTGDTLVYNEARERRALELDIVAVQQAVSACR